MAYPADPADLFARIVGAVELLFDRVDALSWLRDDQVRDIADVIEETALTREDGISPQRTDELFDLADPDDYARRAFAVLLGLDRALMYANPFYGHFDQGAVTQVAVRYAQTGRFNSDATQGVLLPRASFPGRKQYSPNTLNDAFVSVVWIPREEWQSAEHRRTPTRNDFTRIERESGLNVVCVPALEDASELEWRRRSDHEAHFFQIRLKQDISLRRDLPRLLAELDLSGAMIAVLPELALDQDLLARWQEAIVALLPSTESNLKWLVLGTGDVRGAVRAVNRLVILDRITGEEVLAQDKIYPFVLTESQLDEWRLTTVLGKHAIEEDIDSGRRIVVLESHLGRVVALICEDLARLMDLGRPLRAHGISHIFAPVFSKEVQEHHWEHVKAKEYATETGALVVVANSLVVPRLIKQHGPWGTALVHSPTTTQQRATTRWNDQARFYVVAGDPVPLRDEDEQVEREDDDFVA